MTPSTRLQSAALGDIYRPPHPGDDLVTDRTFKYLSGTNDHELVYGYIHAHLVIGHMVEPWLVRELSAWITEARKELDRRGLGKEAHKRENKAWNAYHAHVAETTLLNGYRNYRKWPDTGTPTPDGEGKDW
jgi:hypothetical protein